jgi:hypothetical protein
MKKAMGCAHGLECSVLYYLFIRRRPAHPLFYVSCATTRGSIAGSASPSKHPFAAFVPEPGKECKFFLLRAELFFS